MKKMLILALAVCAALVAGALIADGTESVETQTNLELSTLELSDVLPGTVLDQLSSEAFSLCPRLDIYCLDVYDPVTCSNGVTYSNACYAYRACATGCSSGGASS